MVVGDSNIVTCGCWMIRVKRLHDYFAHKWNEVLANTNRLRIVCYFVPVIFCHVLNVCDDNDTKCVTVPMWYVVYFVIVSYVHC